MGGACVAHTLKGRYTHHRADRSTRLTSHERFGSPARDHFLQPDAEGRRRRSPRNPEWRRAYLGAISLKLALSRAGSDRYVYLLGHILHGFSLGVAECEVVALLAATAPADHDRLRSITGHPAAARASLRYKGRPPATSPARPASHLGSGIALRAGARASSRTSVPGQNLTIASASASRWQMQAVTGRFFRTRERLVHKGHQLSGGCIIFWRSRASLLTETRGSAA